MSTNKNYLTDAQKLRHKAEELLKKKSSKKKVSNSEVDQVRLVHELQVHQVELELQNEELRLANYNTQLAAKDYTELFDFTPACYYTLSEEGDILKLNNSGAQMLGKDSISLIKNRFGLFVSDDTKPIFNQFLQNIYNTKTKQNSEVTLLIGKNLPVYVYLIGLVSDNGKECHINLVDISERKKKEEELKTMYRELTIANGEIVAQKSEIEKGVKELVSIQKRA